MANLSIIIPSVEASRVGNIDLLVHDLESQTLRPWEVLVIKGISPNGLARNMGARRASGEVLVFLDDDVRLGDERVLEGMVGLLEDQRIGMVGAAQLLPPDSSPFQRAAGRQIPRSHSPIVDVVTNSDMVTTQCCAMRRGMFWELGGFNEHIPRGVDPEMRHRVRCAGLRIVVAPRVWYYHPMPANVNALWRMYFRNGQLSAEAVWRMPSAALENPDGHVSQFVARRSTLYKAGRHVGRFFFRLLMLRWIGVVSQSAYLAGYTWRWTQLCRSRGRALSVSRHGEVSKP